jgi:hypothetical protein
MRVAGSCTASAGDGSDNEGNKAMKGGGMNRDQFPDIKYRSYSDRGTGDMEKIIAQVMPISRPTAPDSAVEISLRFSGILAFRCRSNRDP